MKFSIALLQTFPKRQDLRLLSCTEVGAAFAGVPEFGWRKEEREMLHWGNDISVGEKRFNTFFVHIFNLGVMDVSLKKIHSWLSQKIHKDVLIPDPLLSSFPRLSRFDSARTGCFSVTTWL